MAQKVAEPAKGMGAQARVIGRKEGSDEFVLLRMDVEMVMPELRHHLAQLGGRMDGADQTGGDHLVGGADTLGIGHGARPVHEGKRGFGRGPEGGQRAGFVHGRPAAKGVFVGVIGDAQAGGAQSAVKPRIVGRQRQLPIQPALRPKAVELGARGVGGAKGQAVQPEVGKAFAARRGGGAGCNGPRAGARREGCREQARKRGCQHVAPVQHGQPPQGGRGQATPELAWWRRGNLRGGA